ncbi:MAG TPA: hypothetical protein VF453_07245 [Burkholderiaceae bacterium]
MQIDMPKRAFILVLNAMEHYAKHLAADEEDPGPSGDDAMYLRYVHKELCDKFIGEDGKVKADFLP